MATATSQQATMATNRDFDNTGNWDNADVPDPGDSTLLADIIASKGIDGKSITLLLGTPLAHLRVAPTWLGDIGSSGNQLILDADEVRYGADSRKECHLKMDVTNDFYAEHSSMETDALVFTHRTTACPNFWALRGRTKLSPTPTITNLRIVPLTGDDGNCIVTVESGGTLVLLQMKGGRCEYKSTVTLPTVDMFAGELTHNSTGTITAATIDADGNLIMLDGVITTAIVFGGGRLDLSRSAKDKTITTLHALDGAIIDLRNYAGTNTITTLKTYGQPKILMNNGTSLSV